MIKVIGVDPAPSKKTTIFDGEKFEYLKFKQLIEYLNGLKSDEGRVLICWDSPLSFDVENNSPFTKREIEKFFTRKEFEKTPKGISVNGFSNCPHWAISQYVIGYPIIQRAGSRMENPFNLVFNLNDINKSITEVHPAVAIWLWLREDDRSEVGWRYKRDKSVFKEIVEKLKKKKIINFKIEIKNDDELDAYISWKLGSEWCNESNQVDILGNNKTGSFLLPNQKEVFERFTRFMDNIQQTAQDC